jgi:outer membrane protein assembly factor BamB
MRISGISPLSETRWSQEAPLGSHTSHGPALAADPGGKLYRVFKGAEPDTRMHISLSTDGGQLWTEGIPITRVGGGPIGFTSDGPALAFLNNTLHLVWKGVPGDSNMFHATSTDGVKWTGGEVPIGGRTLHGPALAAGPGGRLYRLWRLEAGNEIMISKSTSISADGRVQWEAEGPIAGHTSNTPALVGF